MGEVKGFLKHSRENSPKRTVSERLKDYGEVYKSLSEEDLREQGARCMDCGTPFCHNACPLGNAIPETNSEVYDNNWRGAIEILHSYNNFPEITGRLCPALCESSCTLSINDNAVTVKQLEKEIADRAWQDDLVSNSEPAYRTTKSVAIIGSGPAGLACAQELNRAGHNVTVFERDSEVGGLLRFGIPDFKLEKCILDRRVNQLVDEGIKFELNSWVGRTVSIDEIRNRYDAVCLACGSTLPRDLKVPGRDLQGVHFAMDYLTAQNKSVASKEFKVPEELNASGKRVVVIGGGDTGSDCLGTALRQRAASVIQLEIMSKPPVTRTEENPWPTYPTILRTSTSHEEGGERMWNVSTLSFAGDDAKNVKSVNCVKNNWDRDSSGKLSFKKVKNSDFSIEADLVLLAMGFKGPETKEIVKPLNLKLNSNGVVDAASNYMTNEDGVFVAGDMKLGQSLVVWAISEGRNAAKYISEYLLNGTVK